MAYSDRTWEISASLSWKAVRGHPLISSLPPAAQDQMRVRVHDDDAATIADTREGTLDASCLLPVATTLAAATRSQLIMDTAVDEVALQGARSAARLLDRWYPEWSDASPRAQSVLPAQPPTSQRTSLFYTRGVDSGSSLVSMLESGHPPSALIALDWIDAPYATPQMVRLTAGTLAAAADYGIPLVRMSTNARHWLDSLVGWDRAFGATLATCGLALAGFVDEVGIASSHPIWARQPHGSHPDLDELWSSSNLSVTHRHDVPGGRISRVAVLARDAKALRHLKVCWERGGDGNCGRCTKCLLTMSNLWLAGQPDEALGIFDAPLTVDAVLNVARDPHTSVTNLSEVSDGFHAVATGRVPVPGQRDEAEALSFAQLFAEAWAAAVRARRLSSESTHE